MRILIIILLCVFMVSCKKQYCWTCHTITITNYSNGTSDKNESDQEVCDKTQKDINDYEKKGNYTKNLASQGITITQWMSCSK